MHCEEHFVATARSDNANRELLLWLHRYRRPDLCPRCGHRSRSGAQAGSGLRSGTATAMGTRRCPPRKTRTGNAGVFVVTSKNAGASWGPAHPAPGSFVQLLAAASPTHLALATAPNFAPPWRHDRYRGQPELARFLSSSASGAPIGASQHQRSPGALPRLTLCSAWGEDWSLQHSVRPLPNRHGQRRLSC